MWTYHHLHQSRKSRRHRPQHDLSALPGLTCTVSMYVQLGNTWSSCLSLGHVYVLLLFSLEMALNSPMQVLSIYSYQFVNVSLLSLAT